MKGKTKWILVAVVTWCHRANGHIIGNPQQWIQNPTLSWISLQGQYLLWQLAPLSFPSHWQFVFGLVHRLTLKNVPFSVCTGVVLPSLSTFENTSHFIYFHSFHFQHHRVYEKLTMACSFVGLISLMDRVLCLVIPRVKIQLSLPKLDFFRFSFKP